MIGSFGFSSSGLSSFPLTFTFPVPVIAPGGTVQSISAMALTDIIPVPETGRLKSPQKMPYASLRCEFESHVLAGTLGGWMDVRRVIIEVRGLKPDVVNACAAIRRAFNRNITLTYPSGAKFISFMPDGDAKLTEDPATKDGQDVWLGTIEAKVFSERDD